MSNKQELCIFCKAKLDPAKLNQLEEGWVKIIVSKLGAQPMCLRHEGIPGSVVQEYTHQKSKPSPQDIALYLEDALRDRDRSLKEASYVRG